MYSFAISPNTYSVKFERRVFACKARGKYGNGWVFVFRDWILKIEEFTIC
jgi:hypothetical protein